MEKQKNKTLTYENLRAKPGYGTTGFVEWVDSVLEHSPDEDYILPINKKLETSPPITKDLINHIDGELKRYGEIVKSFYYKPTDMAAYLLKTSDCWHELAFSNLEKYSENPGISENCLLLTPNIFIRKPELNKTLVEFKLDRIFLDNFKNKDSPYWLSVDSANRIFKCHLFGKTEDKEKSLEILSIIPNYEKFVRNQNNLDTAREIMSLDRQVENIRNGFKIRLNKRISPLIKKENNLYKGLEIRLDKK